MGIEWAQRAYRAAFVREVHRLLFAGYARMIDPHLRAADQEEDISGDLCAEMECVVESEPWAAAYIVHNEKPLNDGVRKGKSRFRIDIEVQQSLHRGRRPVFRWEAKRLGPNNGTDGYLGPDGLGCLADGRYTHGHESAGMLAYVQNRTHWRPLIERGLQKRRQSLGLRDGPATRPPITECPTLDGFMTCHATIEVHHVLLRFFDPD